MNAYEIQFYVQRGSQCIEPAHFLGATTSPTKALAEFTFQRRRIPKVAGTVARFTRLVTHIIYLLLQIVFQDYVTK